MLFITTAKFFPVVFARSHCCSVAARSIPRARQEARARAAATGWAASVRSREGSKLRGPAPTERAGPRLAVGAMKSKAKPKPGGKAPQMAFRGYWDATEEQALRDAVQKHGIGAWEKMRHDVDFKVLKCVPSRARARNSSATARSSAARFPPSFHAADARGTRANADNSRFSSQWRGTTDAREEFFAATRFLRGECALGGARGRAAERAGRRLNAHTARRRRAHPAHPLPIPDPYRHRGRTGVQLKDKWRNLIKFQHLRRGEAESAPYKGGARGAAPASAGKRKKGEVDRYASRKSRATEHHARGGRSGVARDRRAAARRARGATHVNSLVGGRTTAAPFSSPRARFARRFRFSRTGGSRRQGGFFFLDSGTFIPRDSRETHRLRAITNRPSPTQRNH